MEDWNRVWYWAVFSHFSVGPESDNYTLTVTGFSSTDSSVGQALDNHNGKMFSTMDRDNDLFHGSCSTDRGGSGGFWFKSCRSANPNGRYVTGGHRSKNGILWKHGDHNNDYSYKSMIYRMVPT